jgi:hypothetical protein
VEEDIAAVKGQIESEMASLAQCTDKVERKMIRKELIALETSRKSLNDRLNFLIREKVRLSQSGKQQLLLHQIVIHFIVGEMKLLSLSVSDMQSSGMYSQFSLD